MKRIKPNDKLEELLSTLESLNNTNLNKDDINKNFKKLCNYLINEFFNNKIFISHNKKDDSAEFIIKIDKYYTKCIDKLLSVYYNKKTNEIVGGMIKGISKQLQEADEQNLKGFVVEINTKDKTFGHVFLVDYQNPEFKPNELLKHIYKL